MESKKIIIIAVLNFLFLKSKQKNLGYFEMLVKNIKKADYLTFLVKLITS